jgi:hypothetical protein
VTIFDLLFLLLVLAALASLLTAAVAALRGRRAQAISVLRRTAVTAVTYFAVIVLVSLLTPQRFVDVGAPQCSDDWCITVEGIQEQAPREDAVPYAVTFRISSRARRVSQRERFVAVHLLDEEGRSYPPLASANEVPFDTLVAAGQSIAATRVFSLPRDVRPAGVVVSREGAGRFPGCCIITSEGSLFHKRTIVRL